MEEYHICKDCFFAQFPAGNSKIKVGKCFQLAGNDFLPINILRTSHACKFWKKAQKPRHARWWKKRTWDSVRKDD